MFDQTPLSDWVQFGRFLDHVLNTPLIQDAALSFACISFMRVLLVGTLSLCIYRIAGMLRTLPKRRDDQTWGHYFSNPWWRTPAVLVTSGMVITILMIALQTFARGKDIHVSRLANVTLYLSVTYSAMCLVALGTAMLAGEFRMRMRSDS